MNEYQHTTPASAELSNGRLRKPATSKGVPRRDADHLRGQIDTVRFQSSAGEIGRQPPRAGPDVTDHRPSAVPEEQVAQQAEHRSVGGHPIENVGKLAGVQLGKGIMCMAQFFSYRVHEDRPATSIVPRDEHTRAVTVLGIGDRARRIQAGSAPLGLAAAFTELALAV